MTWSIDRHQRLRAIFDAALLREPAALDAYLERACADDPELRPQVLRRLAAHSDAHSFLERPPQGAASDAEERFADTERFRVVRPLGGGGMASCMQCTTGFVTKSWPSRPCADPLRPTSIA